jgi:hypothetical protein
MSSSTSSDNKKVLLAAHVLVSRETGAMRRQVIELIDKSVAPMTLTSRVERVEAEEPEDVRAKLAGAPPGALVDLDAKNVADEQMRPLVKVMHLRQVSNALKHLAAIRRVVSCGGAPGAPGAPGAGPRFALVLEDDALFGDQMVDAVTRAAQDAPEDADIVFLGLPSTRKPPAAGQPSSFDDPLQLFSSHVLPACDSYLITPAGAAKLAARFLPIRFCTTAHLTYLLRAGVAKSYVAVPNAFVDGSKVGVLTSSLNQNNQLLWNNPYCRAEATLRRRPYGPDERAQFEQAWGEQMFKEHPDALVLRADHLAAIGSIDEAATTYTKALEMYDRMGCIVNNSSDWLRRYMNMYGLKQPDLVDVTPS